MTDFLDQIVTDAVQGEGPCSGCPASIDGRSQRVNPGLGNPDADLAFVTIEPSKDHTDLIDWSRYESWEDYNKEFLPKAYGWNSGVAIRKILEPFDEYSFEDIWMADSIKCSTNGKSDQDRPAEFACCRRHLLNELNAVDPSIVVLMGRLPVKRSLSVINSEYSSLSVRRNAGRILDTDPLILISTSWSHNHLNWPLIEDWGKGWIETHNHLQGGSYQRVLDVVRSSLNQIIR